MTAWHVLGAGALGGLWAAGLAKAGHPVELLLRNESRLAQFRQTGAITLKHEGNQERVPVAASVTRDETSPIEHLLVATKAHQTLTALEDAAPRLAPGCIVLLVQNGMGVAEQVAEKYPDIKLFCGVTTDGAWCPEPFTVVHAAEGETFIGGFRNAAPAAAVLESLPVNALRLHGCNDIHDRQWQKLAINCAVNGLTAVYRCRNGELLAIEEARARLATLCEEIAHVGAVFGFADWRENLLDRTASVLRLTAANYSSMYQDIHHGRTTEIDYLNGYLIARAKEAGIACPENELLYHQVKGLENNDPT